MIALSFLICFSIVYSEHAEDRKQNSDHGLRFYPLSELKPIIQYSSVLEHLVSDLESATSVPIPAIYADYLPVIINLSSFIITKAGNVTCLDSIQVQNRLSKMTAKDLIGLLRTLNYLGFVLPKNGFDQQTLLSLTVDTLLKLPADADVNLELTEDDETILFEISNHAATFTRLDWKSCSRIVKYLHWNTISDCLGTLCWKIWNTNQASTPDMLNFFCILETQLPLSNAGILATLIQRIVSDIKQPTVSRGLLNLLLKLVRRDAFNMSPYPLICKLIISLRWLPRIEDYIRHMTVIELFELVVLETDVDIISQRSVPLLIKEIEKAPPTNFLYGPGGIQTIDILVKRIANQRDDKTPNRLRHILANLAALFRSNISFRFGYWWITEWLWSMIHDWIKLVSSIVDLIPKYDAFVHSVLVQLYKITWMNELWEIVVKFKNLPPNVCRRTSFLF